MAALPESVITAARWNQARAAALAALPELLTTAAERDQARAAVLAALSTADPGATRDLAAALRSVSSVNLWLAWLANNP